MKKPFRLTNLKLSFLFVLSCILSSGQTPERIPLPEHPRPDFQRQLWLNLNGLWNFKFDQKDVGEKEKWYNNPGNFDKKIMVPFPWGSKLSGVNNEAEIGWYSRQIELPSDWEGKKIYIIFGASDWITTAWLDGQQIGSFCGGYTPFEFEITDLIKKEPKHTLVVRVDDTPHPYKLEGKQGYGQAKGIWQTVYLEARGQSYLKSVHFTPDIDHRKVTARILFSQPAQDGWVVKLRFTNGNQRHPEIVQKAAKGLSDIAFDVQIEEMKLWDPENPFLYETEIILMENNIEYDRVNSYFGMRKIGTMKFPGADYQYVSLNNKPFYLRMCLDQSYNPDGFYTFPSDEFMKTEILRSKRIGLNANRIHIKVEVPRKLYWADKLGLLIMADVPNFWGEPTNEAKNEYMVAMNGMLERDYNHPSIFQWVLFNETWGLFTKDRADEKKSIYLPETQDWIINVFNQARLLDRSRLIEDNSPCNNDHVLTDVNSWHVYIPGYEWKKYMDDVCKKTFPGSSWNFTGNRTQADQPMFNSECGNVWGYAGGTGDVDWTWDYHLMMNEFRRHPKICGWLYTEHHDVVNEWNGYYRYDRTVKYTGLEGIVPEMTINDLHSDVYVAPEGPLCREVKPSEKISLPLMISFLTDRDYGSMLTIRTSLYGWDQLGNFRVYSSDSLPVKYQPWAVRELLPIEIRMPANRGLAILSFVVEDASGNMIHRNFTTFCIGEGKSPRQETLLSDGKSIKIIRFDPNSYTNEKWSVKKWEVFNGLKVNGAGWGFFEYKVPIPEGVSAENTGEVSIIAELSAKQLFGKDKKDSFLPQGDLMLGQGTQDPSLNPNSYPMTDDRKYPSAVRIRVNGESVGTFYLEDDPADHRGILSWFSQPQNKKLNEAGSYGYLVKTPVPRRLIQNADNNLTIRFEVDESLPGGLAIYGERFGRYPIDPSVIFVMKK